MYRLILSTILCLMFITMPVSLMAQQKAAAQDGKVVVDLKTLNEISSNSVSNVLKAIEKEKKAVEEAKALAPKVEEVLENIDPDKFQKYVDTIVSGVTALCKGLGVAVNEFIHTDVGLILTTVIIYNCGGKEIISSLWGIVGGIGAWFSMMAVLYFVFRHFFGSRTVYDIEYDEETGKKQKKKTNARSEKIYSFTSDDARSGVGACIGVAAVFVTLVCLIIIF